MLPLSNPQTANGYEAGMKALSERRFNDAVRQFRGVVEADPDHVEALYQLARIYIASDRSDTAIGLVKRALKLRPAEPALWHALAEAVALGGAEEDEKDFLAALKGAPIPAAAKVPLQDRFGALRKSSRPVTGGIKPRDVKALTGLMAQQRFAEAERHAAAALKAFPKSALVANILATAQAAQKKHAAARASYQTAIRLDPRYAEAYENFGAMLSEMERWGEAVATLRKAVILAPGKVSALVLLGQALLKMNETRAAIILLERAVREEPDYYRAHVSLATAYAQVHNHEDAERAYRRAVELLDDDRNVEIHAALGMAQSRLGKDKEALENIERVLAVNPDHPVALAAKASVLQTLGQFDEAVAMFRRSIEVDPTNGESYRQVIASYRVEPGDKLLADMLELYDSGTLNDTARMNMAFAIAKGLEDIKDYGNVFRYLNEGNALVRKMHPYSITSRLREVEAFKRELDQLDYHATRIEGTSPIAPIFVTGMPRSGTTLVEQIISSHSTVTGGGELSAMAAACNQLLRYAHSGGPLTKLQPEIAKIGHVYAEYLAERFPGAARVTDKAISTFNYIGLIRLALPNARFVVVRRDPRDNLLSIYKNKFPDGTHGYAYDLKDLAAYYGTFVEMIEFWRERVPDWFYEVQYEALVSNPEEETRKLIAACGLEWEDACLSFHENKRKVQTLSVYQVRQPISKGSVKSWQRYEKELEPMLEILRKDGHVAD